MKIYNLVIPLGSKNVFKLIKKHFPSIFQSFYDIGNLSPIITSCFFVTYLIYFCANNIQILPSTLLFIRLNFQKIHTHQNGG